MEFPNNLTGGPWTPYICGAVGATYYLHPISGGELFDVNDYQDKKLFGFFGVFSFCI